MTENRARNLGILALGMLLQGIALTAVSAPTFSVTPYLQHPATNAMTIFFFTTENCDATVKWWRADGKGETFEKSLTETDGKDVSSVLGKNSQATTDKDYVAFTTQYKYRVRLETLRTYTDYEYEVSLAGGPTYRNRFRTFPDRDTPIRFVGYSDSETVPEADADTVTWITHNGTKTYPVKRRQGYATNLVHMVSRQPDVITISGDLAAKGGWQKNWDEFWKQNAGEYGDPAGSIPILAAIGNHDLKDKSSSISGSTGGESALEKYLTYFEYNTNGVDYANAPAAEKETRDLSQLFHREDLGPVTLIFLDTNKGAKGSDKKYTTQTNSDRPPMRSPDFNPGSLQYAWLTNNLADAQRKSRFTFVFNHHCPYSSGKHNSTSDSECAQAVRNLTSAMIKYGVDGWLCGHDEVQEHSQTNGWETLPNGKKRAHTLNIFALGSGGDSVKHSGEYSDSGVENPISVFRAYKDDPDTWTSDNKTLLSGGVHYGHIEVDVTTNKNGQWMCSLTPVYSFVSVDAKTFKRCCYSDRVILQELPIDETSSKEIVYQQAPRFAYGSIPENYVEYERPPQMADPVDPPEPPEPTEDGVLRISEICPKPQMACKTDSSKLTDATDPNGVVAGWIELENRGTGSVDLGAYKLVVANRGKKLKTDEFSNLPAKTLAAGARVVIYTTKDYSSDGDLMFAKSFMNENETRAFVKDEAKGITADEIVLATKVNPKKFPMVRLLKGSDVVDSVIVPADLPDNASVVVQDPGSDGATLRYLTTHPTCGTANDLTDAVKLGPNVGPLYGVKHSFSDLDPVPPATSGQDYEISMDVNPVDAANAKDAIKSVTLVYRTDVNATSYTKLEMTSNSWDSSHGTTWKATVPKGNLPAKGMLLQWKAEIKDVAGNTWTSPAFNGKEAGYEWYGTIVDPGVGNDDGQNSATLPTWHMFAITGANNKKSTTTYWMTDLPGKDSTRGDKCMMNLDYDEVFEDPSTTNNLKVWKEFYPYGARVAIYDAETSNYYDNVRIDCRGNSSDDYYKRSHGLKFSKIKAYKLATPYVHPVSGIEVDEISKTSLCGEFNDPAQFRQRLAFWFMNTVGVHAPWENPKRVNLNGKFYQFAYESPRFNDELLCDIYGFDARGYGYKNVGSLHLWNTCHYKCLCGTSADAGTKMKTPDDGNEKDHTVLHGFIDEIAAAANVKDSAKYPDDTTGLDDATLTAKVVEKFDLPAWLNYLAATRITQEGDDAWGNLSAYYDNAELLDGTVRGTGTWRPLAWDMNCTWGQYYYCHLSGQTRAGLHADKDWNKCHPFYGGMRILGYQQPAASSSYYGSKGANFGFESVFQSTKFRRLFLRRLRTLMDVYLKAPNTEAAATPIAVQMQAYADEVASESKKDRSIWGHLGTTSGNKDCDWVNCWGTTLMSAGGYQPDDPSYGVTDIWNNYIGPRRTHLFTTHAAGAGKTTGYGLNVCAGIPAKQSSISALREKITVQYDADLGAVVIKNTNAETIDLSGWKLTGPVEMTLPPGTVLDQCSDTTPGEVYVAVDRRATIKALTLKDQVVVGNGVTNAASTVRLADATGEPVVPYTVVVTTAADGNGTVTAGGEYEVGANVTLTATPATGYRFTKWTLDDASESKDNPLILENLHRSVGATATFKANEYTIAYDANGGEGEEIPEGSATYDKKYETADCSFVKTGYSCTGWGTNGVGGLVFVCKPGKKVQNLSAENKAKVTLYAMWEPIGYSLVYAPGEATGLAETNTLSYDEAHMVIDCPFEHEGYVFAGWDDGEVYRQPGEIVSNLTTTAGAVVVWTAEWEALSPVPVTEPESIQEITLGVGETIAVTNTYRRNLRFWLFGSTRQSNVVEAELNLPYQSCERYVGYAQRTTVKTNEVVVTLRGVAKGEETVSFGRQYKMKDPVHAVSYRITVK